MSVADHEVEQLDDLWWCDRHEVTYERKCPHCCNDKADSRKGE